MRGPKKSVTAKDLDDIDLSKDKGGEENIDAKMQEFLGGEDDDLKDRGFLDSDDEIDFSQFKVGTLKEESVQEEAASIFGKLTTAFKNITGNKVLTKQDVEPILKEFSENLTDKNVSAEIATEICKNVE